MEYLEIAIDILDHWQSLVGSILGVVGSLFVALIVARSAIRQQERAAAVLLLRELAEMLAMKGAYDELWEIVKASTPDRDQWLVVRMAHRWQVLSPLFEQSMASVHTIDTELAVRLSLFLKYNIEIRTTLDELKRQDSPRLTADEARKRINRMAWMFAATVEHASRSIDLIDQLILKRTATLRRVRRGIWWTKGERRWMRRLQYPDERTPED